MMLKSAMKFTAVALLAAGLMACDDKPDTTPTPPPPATKPTVAANPSSVAPETQVVQGSQPAPVAPANGVDVSLVTGKIGFHLPAGFSDQTQQAGIANTEQSHTQLFIDSHSRQLAVTSEVVPPPGQVIDTSDEAFAGLSKGLLSGLSNQYQDIKKTDEKTLTLGGQRFRRMDTEQRVKGQPVLASTLFTVLDKKVITLQVVTPVNNGAAHETLMKSITDSLKVKG
ncbi:MAG: DUF1795 domain-containing protein [Yersiniaceae bacterium]|nr:DUF1795 domain-containing protein [Yersiniaceae bacterium]